MSTQTKADGVTVINPHGTHPIVRVPDGDGDIEGVTGVVEVQHAGSLRHRSITPATSEDSPVMVNGQDKGHSLGDALLVQAVRKLLTAPGTEDPKFAGARSIAERWLDEQAQQAGKGAPQL